MVGNVRTALLRNVAYVMFEDRIFSPAPGGQKIFDHKEVVAMCWDFFDDDFDWEDFAIIGGIGALIEEEEEERLRKELDEDTEEDSYPY